ncbi:unnamed protein product [Penicillium olsonii]|uniref:BZIP domain-containing protein n=1 Tax=Penicillium olsonii TaxID=99116 RepID=A0A9W4HQN2_PENOL|nr:unnamed protein product [Penicillium olsonii]CAG8162358.1 unnamed protein product [Penicillium olsonii]
MHCRLSLWHIHGSQKSPLTTIGPDLLDRRKCCPTMAPLLSTPLRHRSGVLSSKTWSFLAFSSFPSVNLTMQGLHVDNLGPSSYAFPDLIGIPIPDDEQLWGLSPVSPMADFAHSALERDLKNAQVRNGQPTPPPYDDGRLDLNTASKRRRAHEYKLAADSLSPDLDDGPPDRAKRAKFLERNRLAASKCRQKKKEHTQQLEFSFKEQSEKKDNLMTEIAKLRSEILALKNEVLKHAQCGDEPIKVHLAQMVKKITDIDAPGSSDEPKLDRTVPSLNRTPAPAVAVPVSAPALSFGFDDPMQLEPAAAAAAEAFEQQMRREPETSLISEGSYSFSSEDPTFDDLINV